MKRLLLLSALITCQNAFAFDDHRVGFLLELGLGISQLQMEYGGGNESDTGVATALKIGYGLSETYQLYFVHSMSWMPYAGEVFADGITGIGMNAYIDDNTFIAIAAGAGISTPVTIEAQSYNGSAYSVGIGRELKQHHSVQLNYLATDVDVGSGISTDDFQTKALQVLYSYTFY